MYEGSYSVLGWYFYFGGFLFKNFGNIIIFFKGYVNFMCVFVWVSSFKGFFG